MPSEPAPAHSGSFIVRVWRDRTSESQQRGGWRGSIQHVRNGKQIYFPNFDDLSSFIEQELGIDGSLEETLQGLV